MTKELLKILKEREIVDLGQVYRKGMPVWWGHPDFDIKTLSSLEEGDVSLVNQLSISEHCGTHVDAPGHFVKNAKTIDKIPITDFIGRGLVIDISSLPRNATADLDFIEKWESENTKILKGDFVFFYTGYTTFEEDDFSHDKFMQGWRAISRDVASYLVENQVTAIGTDSMSPDPLDSTTYDAHYVCLASGTPIFENMANLKLLVGKEFVFMALPLKIKGGSGSPLRPIALV